MEDEKLIKLQHFFSVDVRIKKEIYDIAPQGIGEYIDEVSVSKYTDKLNDSLMYIFNELKCVALDIFGMRSNVFDRISYVERIIKEGFYSCGFDMNKLKLFYQKCISNMEPSFIDSVKRECVGYTSGNTSSVDMAFSINELLHFIHSYIINNDEFLQAMPLLDEKNNDYSYPISLRGVRNPVFEQLFNLFPLDLDCGWTDMVVINDKKLIMMVRDRGHALTIEISLNNDIARMEYFIPKLCNIEMINNLPGINKVNENSAGATGVIEVPISTLPGVLFDFISRVPTDNDMIINYRRGI